MLNKQVLFFCTIVLLIAGEIMAQQRPNIVLIISDDHAYQAIGAYGSRYGHTPNIDRLAKEGARFDKAYVTNSICGPSRASILTGKYSNINGFKDNENSNFNFGQDNFAKQLQAAGYQTAWIGKMHLGENTPQGLDYYSILPDQGSYYNPDFIEPGHQVKKYEGYVSNIISDKAGHWLDEREPEKPFCLVIGHKATHRVWMPDLPDLGSFDKTTFALPKDFYDNYATRKAAAVQDMTIAKTMQMGYDLKVYSTEDSLAMDKNVKRMDDEQRARWMAYYTGISKEFYEKKLTGKALTEWKYQRYMRDYLATAASLDRNIGKTLDYLDKHGLAKNTIVIYMSDQGFYMGEHGWFDKRWMYEESFRTPMVLRYPGVVNPGTVINNLIMNIDLAPTFLEAAGIKVPKEIQGKSFMPLLKSNKSYQSRDALYYHYYENGEHAVSPHFGIRTKRYKLIRFYKRVEGWELFDLQKDPHELHNIYSEKTSASTIKILKKELKELIKKYKDEEAEAIID